MTIYFRVKVWTIKGWRIVKNAFKFVRPRTTNTIWVLPVEARCDYCDNNVTCVTLECDYEVVAKICGSCIDRARRVLTKTPPTTSTRASTDHRGVVVG